MFFRAKELVVLDVGSKSLTAMAAEKKSSGVFFVKAYSEVAYSGFEDGNWFDIDELKQCADAALKEVLKRANLRAKTLYISTPAEFTTVSVKDVSVALDRERRIIDADIDFLFKKGDTFNSDSRFQPINTSAVHFSTDDNSRLLIDPRGVHARRLSARAAYISVERSFTELFDYIAYGAGFNAVEYVSSDWAQALTLLEREQRDRESLLLNIGYLSSSVSLVKGEGLLGIKSFSLGGAHITAEIFEKFEAPFDIAEEVRDKIDLNLNYGEEDFVTASDGSGFLCAEVANVIKDSLDGLIQTVATAIEMLGYDMDSYQPLYLTGDGISELRGAVKYFEEAFGKEIEVLSPRLPSYNKPHFSPVVSLITVASKLEGKLQGLFRTI